EDVVCHSDVCICFRVVSVHPGLVTYKRWVLCAFFKTFGRSQLPSFRLIRVQLRRDKLCTSSSNHLTGLREWIHKRSPLLVPTRRWSFFGLI
ncbi:hypothetical protein AVEN_210270-1, partial [Araneus ventricosus]